MNNIKDGVVDLGDVKHVELPDSERAGLLLDPDNILINRTNSKELVGKCAVFYEPGHYVFASYLIRLKLDTDRAAPDFVAFVINSPVGRQQIDAVSRQIIGQANINTEEIRSLQIPLPSPAVQH
jgi:type I restriction enzyme, S subunit